MKKENCSYYYENSFELIEVPELVNPIVYAEHMLSIPDLMS
jgi:hypothetical protein